MPVDAQRVASRLAERGKPLLVMHFREIDSTSDEIKRQLKRDNRKDMLIVADGQRSGRGRLGRDFYSPADTGLYFSLSCKGCHLKFPTQITLAAASAVALSVEKLCETETGIKWVNDVYANGKKTAGILTEMLPLEEESYYVIGIGINVSTVGFPSGLSDIAGSLQSDVSHEELLIEIVDRLTDYLQGGREEELLFEYRKRSFLLGNEIEYRKNGASRRAFALAVADNGALLVRHTDGTEEQLISGEVTLHKE